mgnify:CR=1 FL=1
MPLKVNPQPGRSFNGKGVAQAIRIPFPTPRRLGASLSFVLFVTWTLLLFRVNPVPLGDYGVYTTVAERLIAGDRLYVDVWDNKEPIFFYLLAIGRLFSPLSGWLIEYLWFAVAAVASYTMSIRLGMTIRRSVVVSGIAVPIIFAGAPYEAGSSHIPGLALGLVVIALLQGRHPFLAGLMLGVLPFLKVLVFPVIAVGMVTLLLLTWNARRSFFAALGSMIGAALISLVVYTRGEWAGLLDSTFRYNTSYPDLVVENPSLWNSTLQHLTNVFERPTIISTSVMIFLIAAVLILQNRSEVKAGNSLLVAVTAATTLIASISVLGATGLWFHHAMLLAVPSTLALLSFAAALSWRDQFGTFSMLLAFGYLLAGMPSPDRVVQKLEFARADIWHQVTTPDVSMGGLRFGEKTIARVGGGNEIGWGRLIRGFDLACPNFHQHAWESREWLGRTLECLPNAQLIYVSRGELVPTESPSPWNEYLNSIEDLLRDNYTCNETFGGEICTQRSNT